MNCGCTDPCQNISSVVQPCAPTVASIAANFIAPAVGVPVNVTVDDSSKLYLGQGVFVGTAVYQIGAIISPTIVALVNGGAGLAPGTLVIARDPTFGCFQYPLRGAGLIMIDVPLSITGFADTATPLANSFTIAASVYRAGHISRKVVHFEMEAVGVTASSPNYIGFVVPEPPYVPAARVFAAITIEAGPEQVATARFGTGLYANWIMVSKSPVSVYGNGASRTIRVSGDYEIAG